MGCAHRWRWRLLAGVFGLAGHAGAATAQALISEIKIGALAHDVPGLWSGFRLEHGMAVNGEIILTPGVSFFGGRIQPALGASVHTDGQTSKAYADARWQIESPSGLFFALGLGAAIHDGHLDPDALDRKALGSRVLFHIPAEIGWRWDGHNSISLYFEHVSNGYTQRYNEGLDAIGIRYGYKF